MRCEFRCVLFSFSIPLLFFCLWVMTYSSSFVEKALFPPLNYFTPFSQISWHICVCVGSFLSSLIVNPGRLNLFFLSKIVLAILVSLLLNINFTVILPVSTKICTYFVRSIPKYFSVDWLYLIFSLFWYLVFFLFVATCLLLV